MLLHLIEPTLNDRTGHCYSFVAAFCQANEADAQASVQVWAGRRAEGLLEGLPQTQLQPHFTRRLRRLQAVRLLQRLLQSDGRIFIATASRTDMILLEIASFLLGRIPPGKVVLFVHWFRATPKKEKYLRKLARRQPNLMILSPSMQVIDLFQECGFEHCRFVPYPVTAPAVASDLAVPEFKHVLSAGAARHDKGFGLIVNFIEHLASTGAELPICLQVSPPHSGKHDSETQADLSRLQACGYPQLQTISETLSETDYYAQFTGGICLQLYSLADFEDRISGVTLDALSRGCPIISLGGTWLARVTAEFQAGIVLDGPAPERILAAVDMIRADYQSYHQHAINAARTLEQRHAPRHLAEAVASDW